MLVLLSILELHFIYIIAQYTTTLAFGTLLGVSSAVLPVQDTAHAATQTKGYYYS
jgi:hypothetical protein